MVTKQEQLEWLAGKYESWPVNDAYMVMSGYDIGCCGGCHYITKEEWQQERDKMQKKQDNSWHERGELPPVGTICEMIDDKKTWLECEIIAHKNSFCIGWISSRNAPFYTDDKSEFRPLRTEREKAIEEMDEALRNRGSAISDVILGELYDAGFRISPDK